MPNGKCAFHGGKSTGPKTWEGRQRIAAAALRRGEKWRQENPKLFPDLSARQERRIKKAHREAKRERQRRKLQEEARAWVAKWKGTGEFVPTSPKVFVEFAKTAPKEDMDKLFDLARERVAQQPPALPELTEEQKAEADVFLDKWSINKPKPYVYPADWYAPGHLPPATGTPAPTAEALIERQPRHRIRRLEYEDERKATQDHGRELIERYDLNKRRPVVQGCTLRRRR